MKNIKKIVFITTATVILSGIGANYSYANTLNERMGETLEKKKQLNQELETKEHEKEEIEKQIETILNEIKSIEGQISSKRVDIQAVEEEILELEKQIQQKEIELESNKDGIKDTLQVLSAKGEVSLLEFIFRAENLSQFIARATKITDIYKKNKEMYDEVAEKIRFIEEKTAIVMKKSEELEKELKSLEELNNSLVTKKNEASVLVAEIQNSINDINNDINEQNTKYQALQQELFKQQQTVNTSVQAAPSISGDGVVGLAINWANQRGLGSSNPVTYSMGLRGTDMQLNKYGDCSSFTRRVFLDSGKGDIGWTTAQQITNPRGYFFTNMSELQPGDLIFFGPTGSHRHLVTLPNGSKSAVSHVGIYIGNNQMVDNSSSIGTISIKSFGPGGKYERYVKNSFIGAVRF